MPNEQGFCPYCETGGFDNEAQERPGIGWVNRCINCNRFSVHNDEDGFQYPIQDSKDPKSKVKK